MCWWINQNLAMGSLMMTILPKFCFVIQQLHPKIFILSIIYHFFSFNFVKWKFSYKKFFNLDHIIKWVRGGVKFNKFVKETAAVFVNQYEWYKISFLLWFLKPKTIYFNPQMVAIDWESDKGDTHALKVFWNFSC